MKSLRTQPNEAIEKDKQGQYAEALLFSIQMKFPIYLSYLSSTKLGLALWFDSNKVPSTCYLYIITFTIMLSIKIAHKLVGAVEVSYYKVW